MTKREDKDGSERGSCLEPVEGCGSSALPTLPQLVGRPSWLTIALAGPIARELAKLSPSVFAVWGRWRERTDAYLIEFLVASLALLLVHIKSSKSMLSYLERRSPRPSPTIGTFFPNSLSFLPIELSENLDPRAHILTTTQGRMGRAVRWQWDDAIIPPSSEA